MTCLESLHTRHSGFFAIARVAILNARTPLRIRDLGPRSS